MKPEQLIKLINQNFKINIKERNKNGNYILARDLYYDLSYKFFYPKMTFGQIADKIDRHHSTMLHAIRKRKKAAYKRTLDQYLKVLGKEKPMPDIQLSDKINTELSKRLNIVEHRYRLLKIKYRELTKKSKVNVLDRLADFPEETQQTILERFSLILDAESKKVYSYSEKRRNELKTA